jgi:hypothetical protein
MQSVQGITLNLERKVRNFMRQMLDFPGRFLLPVMLLLAPFFALVGSKTLALPAAPNASSAPARLKAETADAFDHYVHLTEARNEQELSRGTNLLWIDGRPQAEREELYRALKRGEVKMERLETTDQGAPIHCPDGMIHHWTGLIFIPDAKLPQVLGLLQDYNHHTTYYAPDVERSSIESHEGDHFQVFMRFRRHKVITVVLDTVQDVQYHRDSPTRVTSRSSAVRIAQVDDPGKPDEREKPPGDDDGFLWRMETWWRLLEADGGVYVQNEVVSLSRNIPTGLGWLIGPFVTSVPRESLTFTLEATRNAVAKK